MLAIGHFIIGYSTILLAAIILGNRKPYVYPLAYLGGLWTLFPDLPQLRLTPFQVKNIVTDIHNSNTANLFFLHRILDRVYLYDSPDDTTIYIIIGLLLTIIYSARVRWNIGFLDYYQPYSRAFQASNTQHDPFLRKSQLSVGLICRLDWIFVDLFAISMVL